MSNDIVSQPQEAVGIIKDEQRGEDGAELHYAHLYEHLPVGTELFKAPPNYEALVKENERMRELLDESIKELDKADAKIAVLDADNRRLRAPLAIVIRA